MEVKAIPKYRMARPEDIQDLMAFYDEDGLLDTPPEKVEAWIKDRQLFVATDYRASGKPIGMLRMHFVHSLRTDGKSLSKQFSLTTPVRVVKAGPYNPKTRWIVDDFELAGSNYRIDIDNLSVLYSNSFAVHKSERGKLTSVNLPGYSMSQYRQVFESCWTTEQICREEGNGLAARGKLGLLFGSSRDDDIVRRIALHNWQKIVESVWGNSKTVHCLVFEHDRPDGEKVHGNLLTIETALPGSSVSPSWSYGHPPNFERKNVR